MKLRQLKAETSNEEVIEYLKKRHPLYFIANKISPEQINDLVNRLKFKIKQLHGISTKPTDTSKKENNNTMPSSSFSQPMTKQPPPALTTAPPTSSLLGPLPSIGNGTSFKSGSQLPSISNDKKPTFPPTTTLKKQEVVEDDDEEEYDDQYEEEEDEDDGDFDANELLNLTDYQNKRGKLHEKPAMLAASKPMNISKDESEEEDDNGWGDDWGAPKKQDLNNFDYKNTNLNKLSNEQIA
jgi:hypothetical protein